MKLEWFFSNHSVNFKEEFYTSGSATAIYNSSQLSSQMAAQLTALGASLHFQFLDFIG